MTHDLWLAVSFAMLAALSIGCGSQALKVNASVAHAMLEVQAASGPVIRELRKAASVRAGRQAFEAGEPEPVAQAAARNESTRWQCAIDGHRIFAGAVGSYIDTLVLWQAGADFKLADAVPFVARAVAAYTALRSCVDSLNAPELAPILVENPTFLNLVPPDWGVPGVANE